MITIERNSPTTGVDHYELRLAPQRFGHSSVQGRTTFGCDGEVVGSSLQRGCLRMLRRDDVSIDTCVA